ncbi:MAG: hypothetical protein HKO53_15020, partial [Gemmatimonadetes bacterium]|nr:hypothetical protein [Gemmatimonadota bacterium]
MTENQIPTEPESPESPHLTPEELAEEESVAVDALTGEVFAVADDDSDENGVPAG